ncbi:hypothetical protein EV188_10183 [Actinomycetospora succinea]|uniref:Uncharacterized protein n=1 Tax=Actinomycetospora succinea TaxID=663603 RepID=A0A4R6VQM7_9PSEU|nr:hypothetical protein [Actinomycetospora succinea]TDQ64836.1 hypothetical protein EV188_10183 [Actinomycetospora succinea]
MTSTQSSGGHYSGGHYPGGQGDPAWGPPSPPTGYPPPSPPPPPHRRSALRVVGIIAAVLVGVPVLFFVIALVVALVRGPSVAPATGPGSTGSPGPGPVTLLQLKNGDCFNSAPIPADGSTVGVDEVSPVSCSSPHTRQVVNTLAYPNLTWEGGAEAQSGEQCTNSFRTDLRNDVRNDDRYMPARMHGVVTSLGKNSVYVACVIATEAPTTGSALN